jgi:DNA modification methylase
MIANDIAIRQTSWRGEIGGNSYEIWNGDARSLIGEIESNTIDVVITSPPYFWQRDYEVDGQSGHESNVDDFVENLRTIFSSVRRVLKGTGLLFLVIGDTYYSGRGQPKGEDRKQVGRSFARTMMRAVDMSGLGVPRKSLLGIPWRVAIALQSDGWRIRSSITWRKPKSLAEHNARDRPWKTTETVFILSKNEKYFFDRKGLGGDEDVWEISAPRSMKEYPHAAVFPEALVARCLACGCPEGGRVLDPYLGSGTTLRVALQSGRSGIGIELNPKYCEMALRKLEALRS